MVINSGPEVPFAAGPVVAFIMQWCLPLRRQQAGRFASSGIAAKSGERIGRRTNNSDEMEMRRRTSDSIEQQAGSSG